MDPIELYEKLKRIPFLRLGKIDFLPELQQELLANLNKTDFYPFNNGNSGYMNSDLDPIYEQPGFNKNSSEELIYNLTHSLNDNNNKYPKFELQQLGKDCPLLKKATDDLVSEPGAVRLSRMMANNDKMPMHWHYFMDVIPNCTEVVMHIPIITNNKVYAQVKTTNGFVYRQHFKAGEIWFLNAYQMHNTINLSNETRYHLWINCYLNHPDRTPLNLKLAQLLEDKIKTYNGPLLEIPKYDLTGITIN